jgi:hypothetical protein
MFDPKVVLMGVESRISLTTEIALSTKLHRIITPFTAEPRGGNGGVYAVKELPLTYGAG